MLKRSNSFAIANGLTVLTSVRAGLFQFNVHLTCSQSSQLPPQLINLS
ncbi:MAG: hypothetical protein ACTS80_01970 [Candidatus Hodgkinia cicadicola]